jgi:hypothetical protein
MFDRPAGVAFQFSTGWTALQREPTSVALTSFCVALGMTTSSTPSSNVALAWEVFTLAGNATTQNTCSRCFGERTDLSPSRFSVPEDLALILTQRGSRLTWMFSGQKPAKSERAMKALPESLSLVSTGRRSSATARKPILPIADVVAPATFEQLVGAGSDGIDEILDFGE